MMQSVKSLVVLSCVGILLSIECSILNVFVNQSFFDSWMQDEISLVQLRRVLNVCYDKQIEDSTLLCSYEDKEVEFRYNGDYLYMTEGTWIFLYDLDTVYWQIREGLLILYYGRDEKIREVVIGYQ